MAHHPEGETQMKQFSSPVWKISAALVAVVMVLALAGMAQAQNRGTRPEGDRPDREEMIDHMVSRLGLDDEQQEQMKQIHLQHRDDSEALKEQMETARERVDELVDAEQFDEAAIRAAADEYGALQTESFVSRAEMQQEVREILTPEQYEELTQMRDRHHGMSKRHSGGDKGGRSHHSGHKQAPEDG
jgi:protein CpxP